MSDVWSSCFGRLTSSFLQLANDLHDFNVIDARIAKIQIQTQQGLDGFNKIMTDFLQFLVKILQLAILRLSPTVFQRMPLKPAVFHERDVIVEEIAQLLTKQETSRICILGPGGIGKTSVALGVVDHPLIKARFLPENRVWVPCTEATSETLLLEILYTQLQLPRDKQVTIETIISLLSSSTQPRLILLDNFETPYYNQSLVEDMLNIHRQLTMLSHVAILVTMRGRNPPSISAIKWQSKNIFPTDEATCHRIYPDSENDRDVSRLLSVLGHMPFAVTLMARLAKESRSSAEELLLAWSKDGPDILRS